MALIKNYKQKQVRTIEKADLPATINGAVTYYAEILSDYQVDYDTDTEAETDNLISSMADKDKYEGKDKAAVLVFLNEEKAGLTDKYNKELAELNNMIDQLEAE